LSDLKKVFYTENTEATVILSARKSLEIQKKVNGTVSATSFNFV